jgi:hypothetical protein
MPNILRFFHCAFVRLISEHHAYDKPLQVPSNFINSIIDAMWLLKLHVEFSDSWNYARHSLHFKSIPGHKTIKHTANNTVSVFAYSSITTSNFHTGSGERIASCWYRNWNLVGRLPVLLLLFWSQLNPPNGCPRSFPEHSHIEKKRRFMSLPFPRFEPKVGNPLKNSGYYMYHQV